MSASVPKSEGIQPIISFVSVLIIGIVIAIYIVDDDSFTLPIILFSFFLGILIAAIELRVIIKRQNDIQAVEEAKKEQMKDPEIKNQLARFVAELFEEDIPFDELEKEKDRRQSKLSNKSQDKQETVSTNDNNKGKQV